MDTRETLLKLTADIDKMIWEYHDGAQDQNRTVDSDQGVQDTVFEYTAIQCGLNMAREAVQKRLAEIDPSAVSKLSR